MIDARQAALNTLSAVVLKKQSLSGLLERTKAEVRLPDQALYQALVYGVLREYGALSHLRDSLLKAPLKLDEPQIGMILNLGIYQLLRLSLGDHGVLNETVNLAVKNQVGNAKGLINAILRRVQREREQCSAQLDKLKIHNMPAWLGSAYKNKFTQLAEINRQPPPLTLRVRDSREHWLEAYGRLGVANPLHDQAVTLYHGMNVTEIPTFNDGGVSVQDASAQQAATLLAPENGMRILDACSAPGGKTGHILEIAPKAEMLALDYSAKRLQKVTENLARLDLSATCVAADAVDLDTWWDGKMFDRILLDAPCSGSGVLRRHPDIAFVRNTKDLKNLPKMQMRLLKNLWQTLLTGGQLLYTTCSILPRENQHLIEQFMLMRNDVELKLIDVVDAQDTGYGLLHLPDQYGDGFFYALLEKKPQ